MTDPTPPPNKHPDLPAMGPTIGSIPKPPATAEPFFMVGSDDRPLDNRIVAIAISARAELKVGDREFSSPVNLHDVVVLRHFYEARAGSGTIRISAGWPPGLEREKPLRHADVIAEVKRMSGTYVVPKQNQQIVRSFDAFFGTEPAEQVRRLHRVMQQQYEAWKALVAKAVTRLPADAADLHPKMRMSMTYDLITEREIEQIVLIADPAQKGLESIQLDEITSISVSTDTPPTAMPAVRLEDIKLQGEKLADAESDDATDGEKMLDELAKLCDAPRAVAIAALIDQYGVNGIKDDDLARACGSRPKAEQVRAFLVNKQALVG